MTIEAYKEQSLKEGFENFELFLEKECLKHVDRYHYGWECDSKIWIMSNLDKISTNHGKHYIMSNKEFYDYYNNLETYLKNIKDFVCLN